MCSGEPQTAGSVEAGAHTGAVAAPAIRPEQTWDAGGGMRL